MVFVASQDGIGTVFRRHYDRVIMWRPVELDVLLSLEESPTTVPPKDRTTVNESEQG